jgi:hypothetical protein
MWFRNYKQNDQFALLVCSQHRKFGQKELSQKTVLFDLWDFKALVDSAFGL